jgi:hypothetical protein
MRPEERRAHFRLGLSELYLPFYDALCAKLSPHWQPYSGARSFGEQTQIYQSGRTLPGKILTNARAGESGHNWFCATDWTWIDDDGHLTWLKREDPKWAEYVAAVEGVGLRSGAAFGDIDHNELAITIPWGEVCNVWESTGDNPILVKQFLAEHLVNAKPL